MSARATQLPIPVHVALEPPREREGIDRARVQGGDRSSLASADPDWARHGVEPRWIGMETSDCVAALNPSIFHNQGGPELNRFLEGARSRNEVAVIVSTIGSDDEGEVQSIFSPFGSRDATIILPGSQTTIGGQRLPAGAKAALAPDVGAADRDLGLRLLNGCPDGPWWSLSLSGTVMHAGDGSGSVRHEAAGELQPILVDALGAPVTATWLSPAGDVRWYVVPVGAPWPTVLDWLVLQGLAAYVPTALRRARSVEALDETLLTPAESAARSALQELEDSYDSERARLERELTNATAAAEPVRHALLFGTGTELEDAVALVLRDAGFDVTALDQELGATVSADLLASYDGERRLIEVKSASGNAGEALVEQLQRHLRTWDELRPDDPVGGGALVVNHQHRTDPGARSPDVYTRPEFVASLPFRVTSSLQLFDWWRHSDWTSIRAAVVGEAQETPTLQSAALDRDALPPAGGTRRSWRSRLKPNG